MEIAMNPFPTPAENIALNLIFEWPKESRFNRSLDEYIAIARCLPKLEALHAYVNQRLSELAEAGYAPYEICAFKTGDQYYEYKKFPTSLSKETVRKALVKSGMRQLQLQCRHPNH
jgi:hypothetical protein